MCTLIMWYIFLTWRNNVFCRFCAINCLALTYCLILATLNSLPTVNISLCSTCNRLLPTKHRGHSRHRWSLLLHAWHKPRRHHIRIHSRHKWWSREGHVAWLKLHTRKVHTRWRHHPGGRNAKRWKSWHAWRNDLAWWHSWKTGWWKWHSYNSCCLSSCTIRTCNSC